MVIYREVGDRNREASALTLLGIVYGSLSQYSEAIAYYQQALPILQETGDRVFNTLLRSVVLSCLIVVICIANSITVVIVGID
ncbi:MAG: tetratricopeptide repeat protein [Oculatellaceae cyanobacterium bins.114]|nr:tetratricopeptide repeat protein [Oculatellaceae cyanobacterium bins.114]